MNKKIPSIQRILFSRILIILILTVPLYGLLIYNALSQVVMESRFRQSSKYMEPIIAMIREEQDEEVGTVLEYGTRFQDSPYFLLDRNYNFLYPDQPETNEELRNIADAARMLKNRKLLLYRGKRYYFMMKSSAEKGLRLVHLIPRDSFAKDLRLIAYTLLLITLLFSIPCLLALYGILRGKLTPLLRLVDIIGYIEAGQFSKKFIDTSSEESYLISQRINEMVEKMNRLNSENLIIVRKSIREEIKALQSQINPHFLFNTLNTIKSMALNDRTREISKITNDLAEMLRYGIYNLESPTSIEDELGNVTTYLKIQEHRFLQKYEYAIHCPEELKRLICVKFILQPVVENALKHGLRNNGRGRIDIDVKRKGLVLMLEVSDNGHGLAPDELEALVRSLDEEATKEDSIGLRNVHQRIKMIYGTQFGLTLVSVQGEGFRTTITLPVSGSIEKQEGLYL